MKAYRKFMNAVTKIEEFVLCAAMILVLVLTFGNVIARKVFMHSWGFTEEITVAVFVLISMLGSGVAAQEDGGLVGLSLITDRVGPRSRKILRLISWICSMIYSAVLTWEGIGRMIADHTLTPILHIPKMWFWLFIVVGGISLLLHLTCNFINVMRGAEQKTVPEAADRPVSEAVNRPVSEAESRTLAEKKMQDAKPSKMSDPSGAPRAKSGQEGGKRQ